MLGEECEIALRSAEAYKLVSEKGEANDRQHNQVCKTIAGGERKGSHLNPSMGSRAKVKKFRKAVKPEN